MDPGSDRIGALIWDLKDLEDLSRHKKPIVRQWSCERIRVLYGERGGGIILEMLKDNDKDVLSEAVQYFIEYPEKRYADDLLRAYLRERGTTGGKIAEALSLIKEERLLTSIEEKSKKAPLDFFESVSILPSLARIRGDIARDFIEKTLKEIPKDIGPTMFSSLSEAIVISKGNLSDLLRASLNHPDSSELFPVLLKVFTRLSGSWYSEEELTEKTKDKPLPLVVEESADYIKGRGYTDVAGKIKELFKNLRFKDVIDLIWHKTDEILADLKISATEWQLGDGQPAINYRILNALKEVSEEVEEALLPQIALTSTAIFSAFLGFKSLIGINIEDLSIDDALSIFFEDRMDTEEDKGLIDKLIAFYSPSIGRRCIEKIKDREDTYGTIRAIRLLGRMRNLDAIPYLLDALSSDFLSDEAISSLLRMGGTVIWSISAIFKEFDRKRIIPALYILKDIPVEEAIDMILERWEDLWIHNKDALLEAIRGIGSKRFIDPLKKELREGEMYETEVFYLLCLINAVFDPSLKMIEKSIISEKKRVERRFEMLGKGDLRPLLLEPIELELRCLICKRAYHYKIRDIIIDSDKGNPHIIDTVKCKNCNSIDSYEITMAGRLAIMAYFAFLNMHEEREGDVFKEGPVRIGKVRLMDGTPMSLEDGLSYYEKRIRDEPSNPEYLLGYANILRNSKRLEEAVRFYKDVIDLDPLSVEAYASLGQYEEDKGNLKVAYEYFRKASDILHTAHYYKTKDIDQFKEAVLDRVVDIGERLGIRPSQSLSRTVVKQTKVGRNEPCPCGSGKKYKKCCLGKEALLQRSTVTPVEESLIEEILSYYREGRFNKAFEEAYRIYWRRPFYGKGVITLNDKDHPSFGSFIEWFIHDYVLPSGKTIIEEFYDEMFSTLSDEEREILEAWMMGYMDIYEIVSVTAGKGFTMKGVISGKEIDVVDIKGSQNLVRWDIIMARVYSLKGINRLSGVGQVLPRKRKDGLISYLKKESERFNSETGRDEWPAFMKAKAYLVKHYFDDLPEEVPIFLTEEYHTVVISKAIYETKDLQAILHRLGREYDFDLSEEKRGKGYYRFTWLKRGSSKDWDTIAYPQGGIILKSEMVHRSGELSWTTLGTVTITKEEITLECLSKERLAKGKRRLEEVLEDYIIHKADTYEDVKGAVEKFKDEDPDKGKPLPSEIVKPMMESQMRRQLYQWLDEEIPALGWITPREAAKSGAHRERLIELLKDWENIEERKRVKGESYIDISFLKDELGLKL